MKRPAGSRAAPGAREIQAWMERVVGYFTQHHGLPPITARIMGWLLICDPPEQSAAEIAAAIGASRASLTTNMRLLTSSGTVRRLTRPGERTAYYRIDDDGWEEVTRQRLAAMASFRRIAQDGMRLVGQSSPRAARLRAADATFAWLGELLERAPNPGGGRRRR